MYRLVLSFVTTLVCRSLIACLVITFILSNSPVEPTVHFNNGAANVDHSFSLLHNFLSDIIFTIAFCRLYLCNSFFVHSTIRTLILRTLRWLKPRLLTSDLFEHKNILPIHLWLFLIV